MGMGEMIRCRLKESPPGGGSCGAERKKRRRGGRRGLFWSICLAFHFLLFFLPSSLRQRLPSSFARSRRRLRRFRGEVENGAGREGGETGQTTVCLSSIPRRGPRRTTRFPTWQSARTKPLRDGRKTARDNSDPALGSAKDIPGPNPSPLRSCCSFVWWELGSFTPNSVAPGGIRPRQRDPSLQGRFHPAAPRDGRGGRTGRRTTPSAAMGRLSLPSRAEMSPRRGGPVPSPCSR